MLNVNTFHPIVVTTPAGVSTDTSLTVDLETDFSLGDGWRGGDAIILERLDASGVRQPITEAVAISVAGLMTITEGSTGFTAAHTYSILLITGNIDSVEATSVA